MKPFPLPALTIGMDVVTPEGDLPKGAVRRALNTVIHNNGDFHRRPGAEAPIIDLPGAHSFWQSPAQTRVFCAAGDTLYEVDLAGQAIAPAFVGLPFDMPAAYEDVGPDVYFTAGGILRKITPEGLVRTPGVANLLGQRPDLQDTVGTLRPGRYGVCYALVNDLGEESGCSSLRFIDVTSGGILVSGMLTHAEATRVRVYVTPCDGDVAYQALDLPTTTSASITQLDAADGARTANTIGCMPLPGGEFVRLYNGVLYTAWGKWIYASKPLNYGLTDSRNGWLSFRRTITLFEPVQAGIFVGFRERTLFLRGNGPDDFQQIEAANHGAAAGTGCAVPADYFNPDLVPDRATPVACWCAPDVGLVVGRGDGSLVYPQAGRLRMAAATGRPLFMQQEGIKQGIFLSESLTIGVGGAVDVTI